MLNVLKYTVRGYFQKLVREGEQFQRWLTTLAQLDCEGEHYRRDFQLAALREAVMHANSIPFWRRRFAECGIDPLNVASVEDLKKLPLLTKQEVQSNLSSLVSPHAKKLLLSKGLTSGTTGSPGIYYRDLRSVNFENAMTWFIRSKTGMKPGCRLAWLRGDLVVPSSKHEPAFWVRNFAEKKLLVSTYHLVPKYKREILDAIASFHPAGAYAYPSAAYILARWCRELDTKLPFLNLHTSSETLLAEQRELIRSTLDGRWVDNYGQAERVNFFASLDSDDYHVHSEYGVTELIPHSDGLYEIVGSSLHNYAMPLFRYRTGDVVRSLDESGAERPIIRGLSGRKEDFVRLPDGRLIGRLDLVFKGLTNIVEGQIYQVSPGSIVLRIVREDGYCADNQLKLLRNARDRLGHEVELSVEYLERIPRSNDNKFRFVVSNVTH